MPLDAPVSYSSTFREFLIHWEAVEMRTGGAFNLPEGGRLAGESLHAELEQAVSAVRTSMGELHIAREMAKAGRVGVRSSLEKFHAVVRAYWAETLWVDLLPKLPLAGAALDKYLWPCREGLRIWAALEAEPFPAGAPAPLVIGPAGTMGRAQYAAQVEALRLAGLALEAAEFALAVARARRNAVMKRVQAMLSSYVRVLAARLPAEDPLVVTMPRLWPLPGHTPDPVRAAGEWQPEAGKARLTWSESKDEQLDHFQIRGCTGADYDGDDERVLANIPADAERVWETTELLEKPGAAGCFRVYVVTKTGNERASNVVVIERPV